MTALLITDFCGQDAVPLVRRSLSRTTPSVVSAMGADTGLAAVSPSSDVVYDERWLQNLLFRHPELILLEGVEAAANEVAPLCRELPIPRAGGNVFLDVLAVTRTGRLVLVECKLWRNPEARREVVAQILEYAALLRSWSFGDLTARLKQKLGLVGANPIFDEASKRWPDLDEAVFVDGVSRSLDLGEFHLIIAGDGIRSDLMAVSAHLNSGGAGLARLSLLEIQLWAGSSGETLIVPSVPLRTEIIRQRVVVTQAGVPLLLEDETAGSDIAERAIEKMIDPAQATRRGDNRAFWDRFIAMARFDHPDQSPPRHGGDNWVKIDLPGSFGWLTVFRSTGPKAETGLFMRLRGEAGGALFEELSNDIAALRSDSSLDIVPRIQKADPLVGDIGVYRPMSSFSSDDAQLAWLLDASNRFVTTIRPRLSLMEAAE